MNPAHLVVVTDTSETFWIERVVDEVLDSAHQGLPSHLWQTALHLAGDVFESRNGLYWYWYLCLIVVQARPPGEDSATIHLRKELESIFYGLLFG